MKDYYSQDFEKEEINVYTQDGKLFVEGQKEPDDTGTNYLHRGGMFPKEVSQEHGPSATKRKSLKLDQLLLRMGY